MTVPDSLDRVETPRMVLERLRTERLQEVSRPAFTLPDNIASRRVMEKAGFSYERDILRVGLAHVLYRLRRAR